MPKKIPSLHIDLERTWRGGQRQVLFLVRELRAVGHQAFLVSRPGTPIAERFEELRMPVSTMRVFGELDLLAARRIAKIAREQGIRILHAHSSHAHTLALLAARDVPGGRVVVHRRVDFKPGEDALNRWKYRAVDGYVAISKAVRDVLIQSGIDAGKILVVHSAVEYRPPADDARERVRAELGLESTDKLLLNVGALVDHKGHQFLIEAMPTVLARFADLTCAVAGDGELRKELEQQINGLGLGDRVKLLGFRDDVPDLLAAADLYVSTSHLEGLNTSLLDASLAGLPVVATRAGGQVEAVSDGSSGLLAQNRDPADIADKIVTILSDEKLAARLAGGGREFAAEFSPQSMARQVAQFYWSLVD
ncbi:MAG: glycosyltransferase [Candidatus Alcyoniella australis]|nr:glycosyltransferase [Candidatus Alcyoniella australis]